MTVVILLQSIVFSSGNGFNLPPGIAINNPGVCAYVANFAANNVYKSTLDRSMN